MFNSSLTPAQRLEEYYSLLASISSTRKISLKNLTSLQLGEYQNSIELLKVFKARKTMLRKEMVKDCYRCYGTGTPMAFQIDAEMYFPYCEECGRKNLK